MVALRFSIATNFGLMTDPLFAAIFVALLLASVLLVVNVFVWVRLLPSGTRYTNHWHAALQHWGQAKPAPAATWAWAVSLGGIWLGPLVALTGPISVVWGLVLARSYRKDEGASRATRVAARMTVLNGVFFTVLAAVLTLVWLLSYPPPPPR